MASFLARHERFEQVASTQDVVRAWLDAGAPEVCLAAASEQTAGRGRLGRTWVAPPGSSVMLSAGFRPAWLAPDRAWRLAATVSLAMADAAEDAVGLRVGRIRLKWPNDLVVEDDESGTLRKLGGVLGESDGLGTGDPRVVVGIGINAGWPAADFPAELAATMTSLHEISGGRPVDPNALLDGFIDRLEARVEALRTGYFDVATWVDRQVTSGRVVRLDGHGPALEDVLALGVDAESGALLVRDPGFPGGERSVHAGEITRIRLADLPSPNL